MPSKSLKKVRRTQKLGQDRLITLLDKQGREIHDQDKIVERIEEFYTELYKSEQSTIIHTDPKEVPEITSWEVEAALRDMKNGTATDSDHINNESKQEKIPNQSHLLSCTLHAYKKHQYPQPGRTLK